MFFDPKSSQPKAISEEELDEALMNGMIKARIRPELIYAYRRTGRIVNRTGYLNLSPDERAEWDAAIEEYFTAKEEFAVPFRGHRSR